MGPLTLQTPDCTSLLDPQAPSWWHKSRGSRTHLQSVAVQSDVMCTDCPQGTPGPGHKPAPEASENLAGEGGPAGGNQFPAARGSAQRAGK